MAKQDTKKRGRGKGGPREPKEFDQTIVDLSRVTRVTKGGKQMSFRATVLVGDKKGRVGYGVAKGKDVQLAVEKAVRAAKKDVIVVPLTKDNSIAHRTHAKYGSARVMIKPAPKGSGLVCGGGVRMMLELAGVENASSKIFNGGTKINILIATQKALEALRKPHAWQLPEKKAQRAAVVAAEVVAVE